MAILRAALSFCPGDDVDSTRSDVRHGVGPRGDGTSGIGGIGVVFGDQSDVNGLRERLKSDFQSRGESRRGRRGRSRLRRGALDVVDLRHVRRLLLLLRGRVGSIGLDHLAVHEF